MFHKMEEFLILGGKGNEFETERLERNTVVEGINTLKTCEEKPNILHLDGTTDDEEMLKKAIAMSLDDEQVSVLQKVETKLNIQVVHRRKN